MAGQSKNPRRWLTWFSLCLCASVVSPAFAEDWTHWRGPLQNGFSPEKNLPDSWDPRAVGKNNLIWKMPYGCRSTPLVMNGRVYIIGADNEPLGVPTLKEKPLIGERVTCFDAAKGTKIWEHPFNVFHVDIVANRLGWTPLAGDAEGKRIYAHTTAGFLTCFDAETGKVVWQRQLTEEFGRTTGYGGRISGPAFDSGLVIIGFINSNWGNQVVGTNRFFAFDGKNGNVVWTTAVPNQNRGTYYSNPVVTVINGERLAISGGADGALHAFQVRTGKLVWSYLCATGVINPSPVVDGNLVYIAHGVDNPEGGGVGRVVCVDASKIVNGKPTLVWEYRKGFRFGLSSLAIHDGKLYVPDDFAKLYCFDAKKGGNPKWKYNYGTVSRGAPVIADGKIYISEPNSKFHIIKLKEDGSEPDEDETNTVVFRPKMGSTGFVESNCTASIANGRIYIANRDELFCIGKGGKTNAAAPVSKIVEPAAGADDPVAQLQIVPAELTLAPGATAEFELRAFNAKGQLITAAKLDAKWTLPVPPKPKGAAFQPPALDATLDAATGKITPNPKKSSLQGYVDATVGTVTARARVRVVPQIPYKQDFEAIPIGALPGGWVNAQGKYRVDEITEADGTKSKVLAKVNNNSRPPIAQALAYITMPSSTGYTIEADMKGISVREKLPDMGVCANRYLLILDGKPDEQGQRVARLTTWEALPTPLPAGRIAAVVPFKWDEKKWYRVKLTVEVGANDAKVRGKIWERGKAEPEQWTLELTDPRPNREGAAALYGYITNADITETNPGAEIYYDNVAITPNAKK